VTVLWAGGLGLTFQQGQVIFLFAEASRLPRPYSVGTGGLFHQAEAVTV
jgi:hypothetical protein